MQSIFVHVVHFVHAKMSFKLLDSRLLPKNPITRFAPSPTGYLHLGHVISMAYVFGVAALSGAKVLLRIEDHDRQRYRKEYEQAIIDDMAWLGFIPDNWQEFQTEKRPSDFRQSDCSQHYAAALEVLAKHNKTYYCECSRKILVENPDALEQRYPGTCRSKNLLATHSHGLRLHLSDNEEKNFTDLIHGTVIQNPAQQCGDFLLKDRHGYFTYNFAVVVDDIRHGVNFIIRGADLLHCTGRQLTLRQHLGHRDTPLFLHHPLITDASGKKLSKRTFAEGIIQRRERGDSPHNVIGEALFLTGMLPRQMPIKASEVAKVISQASASQLASYHR